MKFNIILFFLCFSLPSICKSQVIYQSTRGLVEFYSETPTVKISGKNENLLTKLDVSTGLVMLEIKMGDFIFQDKFVEYQFNGNYLQTNRYPKAVFKGRISPMFNLSKPGQYESDITGKMLIHGVISSRKIRIKVKVLPNRVIEVNSVFIIPLKDHAIQIPSEMEHKIARIVGIYFKTSLVCKN